MDNLQNFRRTDYCGTFTAANIGQEVSVCGWVQRQRNLGGLIFVDLRDRTGLLQLSSRYDVQQFLARCSDARPLSDLTEGIHLHTLSCPDEAVYERVLAALDAAGFLLK